MVLCGVSADYMFFNFSGDPSKYPLDNSATWRNYVVVPNYA